MRKLFSILVLMLVSASTFAGPVDLPEPETLSLLGLGLAALMLSRRSKK